MANQFLSDEQTIEALKAISGSETVRVQQGEDAEGKPRTVEGYAVNDQEYVFRNDKMQSVHVPRHRVDGTPNLADATPAPATLAAPATADPAAPPASPAPAATATPAPAATKGGK